MNNILNSFEPFDFLWLIWLFLIVFILHEVEEWNIADFERRNFVGVPDFVTKKNAHIWIGIICAIGFIWCALATLPGNPKIAAYVLLPAVALAFGNALQHIFWAFYFRQYAPGLITGVLLIIPLGCYIVMQAVHQGYVSLWYVVVLAGFILIPLVHTIKAGNEMTPPIRAIYRLGTWLSSVMEKSSFP